MTLARLTVHILIAIALCILLLIAGMVPVSQAH
jgi:hypothetical protein